MRLDIRLDKETALPDGSREWLLNVPSVQLVRLGYILEALDGWCSFTTVQRGCTIRLRVVAPLDWAGPCAKLLRQLSAAATP
ncbi:MAG: hypothetical protein K8R90_04185 [Candidatus Cloacimonetes bacterium]|nr:hypothetical protein [Candidatus Cloacimonadota bacterium]